MFLLFAIQETKQLPFNDLAVGIFLVLMPLCMLIVSFIFISAGIISIKRERFSIAHSISIIFGIGIWSVFGVVYLLTNRTRLSIIISSILVLVVFAAVYVSFTFTAFLIYSQLYTLIPKNKNCDFIIIHGAGLAGGYRVTPLLARRLDKGIEVFKHSKERAKIIVSGGQGNDEKVSEAFAMKMYLLEKGISEDSIITEDKSTTTLENMEFSKKIMDEMSKDYRCIFVTNNYHVFRTGTYARKVGLKAEGVGCKTAFYYWPNAFIREYIAIMIKYKLIPIIIILIWILGTICSFLRV